jgi:transcriptional regulator with PAS, ATPase and Fis domain
VEVKRLAKRIAKTDSTVLLQSESGTGKELYAQAIHNASPRANELFVAINCANFNADLLDSELFGYERGAFTGAAGEGKIGLFEAAHKGTLFLDEISEMPLPLQSKLLRVLQERRLRRVGAVREIDVDVRIIAACNANLTQYIKDGKFRKDLYFRLNVFSIRVPPLRDRIEEIDALAERILAEFSQTRKRPITITDEAMDCLKRYAWPGNVRELRNVLESSGYLSENGIIDVGVLPNHISKMSESPPQPAQNPARAVTFAAPAATAAATLAQRVKLFERNEIHKILRKYGDDVAAKKNAARDLGISLATLYNKIS